MKYYHTLTIILLFCVAFISTSISAEAKTDVQVFVHKTKVEFDQPPRLVNDRTMIPIRKTLEALGATVLWEEGSDKVSITNGKNQVVLQFNNPVAYQNGLRILIDSPPFVDKGRMFVPLRFISEAFNYDVFWNGKSYRVDIEDPEEFAPEDIQIPVLMYHEIEPNRASTAIISPERFQEHMLAINNRGFTTITEQDLLDFMENKKPLPNKPILITFDDGYKSNYTYAYPVLKQYGMKATVHLITSRVVAGENQYPHERLKFSWEEARNSMDVFTFQGHTHDSHYKNKNELNRLQGMITGKMHLADGRLETQAEFEKRVLTDLVTSKKMIEDQLGQEVIGLAYPYGHYSEDTIRLAKEAGYKLAFTVKSGKVGKNDPDLYQLNRINGHGNLTGQQLLAEIDKY